MRPLFIILTLTFVSPVFAQPNYPVLFRSKALTTQEITIPGTRVSMIPPQSFQLGVSFTGLKNGSSLIEVFDLPGGRYGTISQDFTLQKFEDQQLHVFSVEEIAIDGYQGRLISLQTDEHQHGFSLVFGDDSFSVIVVSNYPANDIILKGEIRKSLLGIRYEKSAARNDLSTAAFRFNEAKSSFCYDKRAANTFFFLKNDPGTDNPYVTVTQLSWDFATTPSTIGELMLIEMQKYGINNTAIRKRSSRTINGYRAYESEIYATRKGEKCLVYQMVMVHDSRALVVHGIGNTDFKKNRVAFRKLAHSIRFK
jgi:hypothetical protein